VNADFSRVQRIVLIRKDSGTTHGSFYKTGRQIMAFSRSRSWPPRLGLTIAGIAALILITDVSPGRAGDRPVGSGLVVSATGSVVLRHGKAPQSVNEGAALREGDTLVVAPGAACRGFDPEGRSFALDGPAEAVFVSHQAGSVLGSVGAWVSRQLADWVGAGRSQPLLTRSIRTWEAQSPAPQLLLPANGGRARPGKVRLRWAVIPGIQKYKVTIAPASGTETSHAANEGELVLEDLKPGEDYVWKVSPALPGWSGFSAWSAFKVLSEAEDAQLDSALRDLGDLEAGVLLLSSGLHEEAVLKCDAAVSGKDARAAHLWRARALSEIGLYKQACEDLQSAGR
jgi:hypothetical protein